MISNTIEIWENGLFKNKETNFNPTLDTYILKCFNKKRGAVLICPGGGYNFTSERESEPIALKFNSAGYHSFVLHYSAPPAKYTQPLMDVSRAMCIIRDNAEKWNIDSDKIAVCGFSAGGHVAANLGVNWNSSYLKDIPGIKIGNNKPNAIILCYPVITSGKFCHKRSFIRLLGNDFSEELLDEMSLENHVNSETPPTFIWHTVSDTSVPVENSLLFVKGLRKNNIPFELHIYPDGPHGLSLATAETDNGKVGVLPHVATWMNLCIEWLNKQFKEVIQK